MNVETDTGYPTHDMYVCTRIYYVSLCVYDVLVHVYTMMSDECSYKRRYRYSTGSDKTLKKEFICCLFVHVLYLKSF